MTATILCISFSGLKLGAAYYEEDTAEVKILHDTAEDENNYFFLKCLLRETKPSQIIVNVAQDKLFIKELCRLCNYTVPVDISNITNTNASKSTTSNSASTLQVTQNNTFAKDIAKPAQDRLIPIPNTISIFERFEKNTTLNSEKTTTAIEFINSNNADKKDNNDDAIPKFSGRNLITEELSDDKDKSTEHIEDEENIMVPDDDFFPTLCFFPNLAFSFGEAKKRLEKIFSDNVRDPKLLTAFRFDYSAFNMIRALGALLRFLDQQRIGVEFEAYEVKTPINIIKSIYLNDMLEVDSTTYLALEIFYSNYNPSSIRKKFVFGNARKTGISLFNLCNICRSTPGRTLLRYWFDCPTKNRDILNQRHEAISFFYHDCNLDAGRSIRNMLKDIMSCKGIIKRMSSGNVSISDWKNLYLTVCALVKIGEYIVEREIKLKILADKMKFFNDELVRLANVLTEIIDFRESLTEGRFVINKSVDEKLDELKETYDQLPEMLTNIARSEAEELGIESCSVAYVPIIGYLLLVPETYTITGNAMIQLIFSAEGMFHYKSRRMQLLDEQIGDIKMQIIDMETTVMLRLQRLIIKRSKVVLNALEVAATLDCILSLSVIAREYNWNRPKFIEEKILEIKNARHPIAELLCKHSNYTPNPIISNEEEGKVKILSGPNASGKSVYLKMVGIIVYLAHIGSFVPADQAIIGPINRIMSRMHTVDSVLDGMSSFANDLKQMSGAIRRSDGSSLLIIDEFGKGTMTEVGLSLLASCLNYWLKKESIDLIPHLFVASHFHALRSLLHDSNTVSFKTMDVTRKENDVLEFQFRLVDGIIDNSFATVTALRMNIPQHIVNRADEIYLHLKVGSSLAELTLKDEKKEKQSIDLANRMESLIDSFRLWNMEEDSQGFIEFAKEVLISGKYTDEGDSSINEITNETDKNNKENNSQVNLIDSNLCEISNMELLNNLNATVQIFEMTAECSSESFAPKTSILENSISENLSIIIDGTKECLNIMKDPNLIKTEEIDSETIDENNNLN